VEIGTSGRGKRDLYFITCDEGEAQQGEKYYKPDKLEPGREASPVEEFLDRNMRASTVCPYKEAFYL